MSKNENQSDDSNHNKSTTKETYTLPRMFINYSKAVAGRVPESLEDFSKILAEQLMKNSQDNNHDQNNNNHHYNSNNNYDNNPNGPSLK